MRNKVHKRCWCLFLVQHVLLKPNVKGVEDDEDLPEEPWYAILYFTI